MFDLTSMKLLILGLVALIVVGPKDLPVLLRTIGKYVGMIRRQAAEFRTQFDEAMRDNELQTLRDEVAAMKRDVTATVESAGKSLEAEVAATSREIDNTIKAPGPAPAAALPAPAVTGANDTAPLPLPAPAAADAPIRPAAIPEPVAHSIGKVGS